MDARLKRRIHVIEAIGGQEHDAFKVLEEAEEDGDESVAVEVVRAAGFHEDICFVKQQHYDLSALHTSTK
jgi:hypothetical protein